MMKRWILAAMLALPASVRAADPAPGAGVASSTGTAAPLTLRRAFELASTHSERLDIQAEEIEQSKTLYRRTRGGVLPDLRFILNHTIQDTSGAGGGENVQRTLTQRERTESRFTIEQPIFKGFREFAALSSLKADERKQRLLFQRVASVLYQDVASVFFNVVSLETELSDLQALMKLTDDRLKELRGRVNLGKSRGGDITTSESQYAVYKAREASLRGSIASAREELSFLIGQPVGATPLEDTIPLPTAAPDLSTLVGRSGERSDVAALREEVVARRYGIRVARAGHWPGVDLEGNYYTKRPGFQDEIDWDVVFTLDVPIYQGGANAALVDEAKSLLRQAEADHKRLARLTESDVRRAHALLTSSIEEATLLDDAVKKSRRSYESLVKEYRLGLANNLDVLQAMNALQTVKRDFDLARLQSKLDQLNLRLAVEMAPEDLP